MRRAAAILLLTLLTACADKGEAPAPELDELRGQWVVINYWAQWCKPCIEEIPELNALNEAYDTVTVLGVNYDGATGADLDNQTRSLGVAFPTLKHDPSGQLGIPRPVALPTTLIVSPRGELKETLLGPQTLGSLSLATEQTAVGNRK
ncbi:TlpA disulfide reductase family protein [Candidatus Marimicrobium litorale]|nr:TlpA disulfide reductase family protein [Candidatus Marimicrobium litorale]